MKKILFKFKIATFLLVFLEIGILIATAVLYFLNETVREFLTPKVLYIGLGSLIVFDLFWVWLSTLNFGKLKKENILRAADLLGGDIQDAYNFGMIGLIIVDENNTVLWTNEFLRERRIEILDTNILEWEPKLLELQNSGNDKVIKIEQNARNYDVKYLSEAGLYILKDTTNFETIFDYSQKQAMVIGIIMIDNYTDISGTIDDSNDTISKIRNAIFEYTHEFGVLIKRYKNDAYLMVCNHESLQKMIDDKFSLIEQVHTIGEKEENPPTLSFGIAHDFPDVLRLYEMANSAIEIAMSRGGDQAVISQYGHELMFFGGKVDAIESRNKVKVRVLADSVISLIKNSSNVLIMGHTNADMDAIGACLGLKAICDYCQIDSKIVYNQKEAERKVRAAMLTSFSKEEMSEICVSGNDAVGELTPNTLVIVCDVHRPSLTMCPKLLEKATKIMVIDHHRRSEEFIDSPVFSYVEPSASSSSEMVAELIKYASVNPRISVPSVYATIMLSGIFLDTNFFKTKGCGIRTFEASMILKEFGADNSKADEYLKDEFEEYTLITKIISTLKTPYYGVVYCVADQDDIIEASTLAKVGNQCMQMKGVNACFVIGRTSTSETRISCRSDGTINVQLIAEKLNGGGHFEQAAGTFKNVPINKVEDKLLDVLETYLNDARIERN